MPRLLSLLVLALHGVLCRLQRGGLRLMGFRSAWVPTDVGRCHALVRGRRGDGPTWIFVHGLSSQAADWALLLLALRRRVARLVVLDMPGHGRSAAPPATADQGDALLVGTEQTLGALLEPAERAVLVGNSLGGLAAVRMAQRRPHSVGALVLISPAGAPMSPEELAGTLDHFELDSFGRALAFVDRIFVHGSRARHALALLMWAHINRPQLRQLLPALRRGGYLTPDALRALPPTLLIWGGRDLVLPPTSQAWFAAHLPAASTDVVTPPHFGHTPFLDLAPAVGAAILEWAERRGGLLLPEAGAAAPARTAARCL